MGRKKSSKAPAPMMITAASVKRRIKEREDLRCDGGLIEALNEKVDCLIEEAIDRCEANGRKTVRPADL